MKSIITTTFAALLLLTACSRKDTATIPSPDKPKTNKELIVGSWVLTAATSDDLDNPYEPDECEYDDFYTFNSDGTWVFQDGGIICEPDLPMISGTWQMDNYPVLDMDSKHIAISRKIKFCNWMLQRLNLSVGFQRGLTKNIRSR